MNQDAIVVALDFIKGQILELKTDIKAISTSQRSLEEEIRKGYVTKEQFEELKLKVATLEKNYSELKALAIKITTAISIATTIGAFLINYFFNK